MSKKLKTDMKPRKEKIKFFSTFNQGFSGPIIELSSNREAAVDGCKGVVDYYENLIKLRVDSGFVIFTGSGLRLAELNDNSALICGKIENIELVMR